MFPALPGTPFRGLSLFPLERTMRDPPFLLPLPRTQLPAQTSLAVSQPLRPRCAPSPLAVMGLGRAIARKGPRNAGREGKGPPQISPSSSWPLVWLPPLEGLRGSRVVPGQDKPTWCWGGPQTKQVILAVRLFAFPLSLLRREQKRLP